MAEQEAQRSGRKTASRSSFHMYPAQMPKEQHARECESKEPLLDARKSKGRIVTLAAIERLDIGADKWERSTNKHVVGRREVVRQVYQI
jgi:hypothetical protein